MRRHWVAHIPLLLILLLSLLLRVQLVRHGGQGYWPDEIAYDDAKAALTSLERGDYGPAIATMNRYGPMLFKVVALIPAALEMRYGEPWRVPGFFFAMFSVVNIVLIGRLAKGLGARPAEALLASLLLAMSTTFFYSARHLLPYDLATTVFLVATHVGVRSGSSLRGCFVSGLLATCTFLTYNGYWTLAAIVPLLNAVAWPRPARDAFRRLLVSGAGAGAMALAVLGVSSLAGGGLITSYRTFGAAISQGDFQEGWRLPFEYLWHAEHVLLVAWLAGVAWCVATVTRSWTSPRVRVGLTATLVVFTALAVSSTLVHAFVVYGRLARQLVPFLCLVTAYGLGRALAARSVVVRGLVPIALVILLAQTAVNFQTPLRQTFPDELEHKFGPSHLTDLIWVNVEHIYPAPRAMVLPEHYALVFQAPHPLEYWPYQYEGYTPAERRLLRTTDIRMRILARLPTP